MDDFFFNLQREMEEKKLKESSYQRKIELDRLNYKRDTELYNLNNHRNIELYKFNQDLFQKICEISK